MKRIVFIVFGLAFMVMAAEGRYEITPTISGVFPEKDTQLENYLSVGLRVGQYFDNEFINKVESGVEITKANYEDLGAGKSERQAIITRYFAHAIKEFEISENTYFYALVGAGYENVRKKARYGNNDSPYGNYGVGFRYALTDDFYLRTEFRHAIKLHSEGGDNNLLATLGISYALGEKSESKADPFSSYAQSKSIKDDEIFIEINEKNMEEVEEADNTQQTVVETERHESAVEVQNAAEEAHEDAIEQAVGKFEYTLEQSAVDVIDSDNDGVSDELDLCPNTPAEFKVDSVGCIKSVTLKINFSTGGADIPESFKPQIESVAKVLINEIDYKVILEGHTDSSGDKKKNLTLSEQRVKKVAQELVGMGVDESRIFVEWFGSEKPAASNNNAEGRAENRRVEAFFIK
ncbi:MAG: OmpA family protein [Campylobacteraceae bacterium]|jgi:outer membrane protein OmpA-like peptidoglycan-associated protein|nr:OmpA family protein [Campylobacteraceae bacterium]